VPRRVSDYQSLAYLADAADLALVAVVDVFVGVVIIKLARLAVVPRKIVFAVGARFGHRLRCAAPHARDHLGRVPVERVVLLFIVAEPTGVPLAAALALQLAAASGVRE
jgi:hypothetical protein